MRAAYVQCYILALQGVFYNDEKVTCVYHVSRKYFENDRISLTKQCIDTKFKLQTPR